ncbi:MAG: outer membrane protein assembly factor BamE domain-containing protein [Leptospirales bacterium]
MHSLSVSVSSAYGQLVRRVSLSLLCLGVVFLVVTGCIRQAGTPVSPMSIAQLHEGKSTMNDVRRVLGKPDEVKRLLGDETWIYRHTRTTGWVNQNTKVSEVWILFSSQGIVRQIRLQEYQGNQFF